MNYYPQITGCGKSTYVLSQIASSPESYVIAVPSKDLCYATLDTLKSFDPAITPRVINSDSFVGTSTASRLIKSMMLKLDRVIITTHETLKLAIAQGLDNQSHFNLVIDEKLDFFSSHTIILNDWSLSSLDDLFNFQKISDALYKLTAKTQHQIKEIVAGARIDSLIQKDSESEFLKLVSAISNDAFNVTVTATEYERFTDKTRAGVEKRFTALSIIKPEAFEAFKSCTILSSLFDQTVAFKMLASQFNMVRCSLPNEKAAHDGSEKLHIHWYHDGVWTKALRNAETEDGSTVLNHLWDHATESVGDEPFIYHLNVDSRHIAEQSKNGTLLTSLHGLNTYQHITKAVFLSSLNASPEEVAALSGYLEDGRASLDHERNVLEAYQFISRTAIRSKDNTNDVHVYVPDSRCAEFLQELFPHATTIEETVDVMVALEQKKAAKKAAKHVDRISETDRKAVYRVHQKLSLGKRIMPRAAERYSSICKAHGLENKLAS